MLTQPTRDHASQLFHVAPKGTVIQRTDKIMTTNNLMRAIVYSLQKKLENSNKSKASLTLDGNYIVVHDAGDITEEFLRDLHDNDDTLGITKILPEENVGKITLKRDKKHFYCFELTHSMAMLKITTLTKYEISSVFKKMKFVFLGSTLPKKTPVIIQ